MLKFVSQNEKPNEKLITEELEIDTSLLDFLSSSDYNDIKKKIKNTLNDIKLQSKKIDSFYTKLLFYFSLVIENKKFKFNDKSKTCIDNIINICESESLLNVYQDLFNLFDNNEKEFKKYILSKILNSEYKFVENDFQNFYILFINYLETDLDSEILEKFAKYISDKKNYELLSNISNINNFHKHLSKEKDIISKSVLISKLYFYVTMTSPDLVDINLEKKLGLNSDLKEEIKLIDLLDNCENKEILFEYKSENLEKDYGNEATEKILTGVKENCLHEILLSFIDDKKNVIQFKELINEIYDDEEDDDEDDKKNKTKKETITDENEILEKFGILEDMLIAGNEHGLYNLVIDYFKKEIKVLYIRRSEYDEEQKKALLSKVKDMKSKLEMILKAVEKI